MDQLNQQVDDARKRVPLENLDDTNSLNWFTIRTLLTSGTGFMTDAYVPPSRYYDVFIINLVTPMLGYVYVYALHLLLLTSTHIQYFSDAGNIMPANIEGAVKGMASVGTLIGQLVFGFLGDALGRQKIYGLELLIIIFATVCCAMSSSTVRGVSVFGFLGFWRLILGIGVGGDYPMSATITSEWAAAGRRGRNMALIFSMQGIGNLAASLVTLALLAIFKDAIEADVMNLDYVWRLAIGVGAIPAAATVYLRLTMPESPRYALDVQGDSAKAAKAVNIQMGKSLEEQTVVDQGFTSKKNHSKDFRDYFSQWKNLKILLGTSLSWFFLDIAFYGLNLNNSYILSAIGYSKKATAFDTLWATVVGNIIISCLGFVPGYFVTVALVDRWGRKKIQIMGFSILTVLFIVLSAGFYQIKNEAVGLFITIFTLAQFFFNFGPNSTTFIVPGEVFPTKVRASAHGISAASGKLGAIIATFGFNSMVEIGDTYSGQHAFLPQTLGIFAVIMFLGLLSTFLIPETMGRSLDEFEEDHQENNV
ncbi:major facilitator superfamily domain-containing protein [Jimgerdemannia flammicorona]|uniref:Major facilitator superfamily domain-containing protein n=1 Tax=Jimgerdemannia flammicorona TaxID=994334 RepID=A0A433D4X6_9FUNG|nr:major facilitator superfamily domain-containing protein [Jimgerdemannia flammicorona]